MKTVSLPGVCHIGSIPFPDTGNGAIVKNGARGLLAVSSRHQGAGMVAAQGTWSPEPVSPAGLEHHKHLFIPVEQNICKVMWP